MGRTHVITENVYRFVEQYWNEQSMSPSLRDIETGCYISRGSLLRHLDKLEAWGWLYREPGRARNIVVLKHNMVKPVPDED